VERAAGARNVVRELRSQPPLRLIPRRAAVRDEDAAVVHLVGSAMSPLGGDDADLRVHVGPGARLRLRGTAATVALPGQRPGGSRAGVRIEVAEGGTVEYLPEPLIVAAGAWHEAELRVDLAEGARARCRETLILGRSGEEPGVLRTMTHWVRAGVPLFRQELELGDQRLRESLAFLGGARVLASESIVWDSDPVESFSARWAALTPLPHRGALATAFAADAVTARRRLAEVVAKHPDAHAAAFDLTGFQRPHW
jgi:urease accessory protein